MNKLVKIEHKTVSCCECKFFARDAVGFGDGIGSCDVEFLLDKITKKYPLYPNTERICDLFNPIEDIKQIV